MAVIISGISAPISAEKDELIAAALKKISISRSSVFSADIHKISIDARRQSDIKLAASVYLSLDANKEAELCRRYSFCSECSDDTEINIPKGIEKQNGRIVIAGFGPAGMFAALLLAENGYAPIVLERGEAVDDRVKRVTDFWNGGELDENCSVQFGEGGAGTFSDGKLTTRINDKRCRYILKRFCEMGAPEEIMFKAKPHIGTDKLRGVVKNIRRRIIECGGEVRFSTVLRSIKTENGVLKTVTAENVRSGVREEIPVSALVLAIGHSSRDTFEMLLGSGVFLEPKPFSVGVRIEHLQEEVDYSLYGKQAGNPLLPKGEYQLSHRRDGRGVYTFCMCPGGVVVPSQSEKNTVVTNGMSEFLRDGKNANAAVAVSVSPEDFGNHPLDGVKFARSIEKKAYEMTGSYKAPAVTVGNFLKRKTGLDGGIEPSYAIGVAEGDLYGIFPNFVTDMLCEGLGVFARKMKCFGNSSAVLTAPETRTSSPVRISRNEEFEAVGIKGLYPCGEGAGYAGGITSAAADGLRIAEKLISRFSPV